MANVVAAQFACKAPRITIESEIILTGFACVLCIMPSLRLIVLCIQQKPMPSMRVSDQAEQHYDRQRA